MSLLFPWADVAPTIDAIRCFFSVVSALKNLAYVSLAVVRKVNCL
ncbi:MAG: hypothetical protein ABMA26_02290 [Limisphaerales bacterium]